MKTSILTPEGDGRPLNNNQARAHEAAPQTQPAPEVAVPPVQIEGLRLTVDVPNTGAQIVLQPELVQLLVFVLVLKAAGLIRERSLEDFRTEVEALAKGDLSGPITGIVSALVREALTDCSAATAARRAYATAMLPAAPDVAALAASVGVVGCAAVDGGYDVALVGADDSAHTVVSVALPMFLLADIVEAVLLTVARILAAPSDLKAQGLLRRLVTGSTERELGEAVAFAIIGAVNESAKVPATHKRVFLSSPIVVQLLERPAA
jgi:hypothetical protein